MLLLHIGRGKAGSSTIQNTIDSNRAALAAAGVAVPSAAAAFRGHAVDVYNGMQGTEGHEGALPALRALLDDPANRHVFVSSEFLFNATRREIERLKQALGPHDLRVFVYLRAYPDWLRSLYAQGVKRGRRTTDFDAFHEAAAKRVPSRAPLSRWADAFGWDRLRIRHLGGLEGKGLVADLSAVVGCPLVAGPDQNTSPHWLETEFTRAFYAHAAATGAAPPARGQLAAVLTVVREAIEQHAPPDAEYCTLAQHRALEDAYLADAAWLAQRTDAPLPPATPDRTRERPFLPDLAAAPEVVRETVGKRLRRSLRLKEQPEVRDLALAVIGAHWPQAESAGDPVSARLMV